MKKRTSFLTVLIAILSISVLACNIKIQEEELFDKPLVNVTTKQVTIIIPKMSSDTDYINVYRRDKQNDKVINIGIIYPEALENDGKNYSYIDELVKKGHSYDYRTRYHTNGEYYYSEWSDTIEIKSTYNFYADADVLLYKPGSTYLLYNRDDYSLTIKGTITAPTAITDFSTDYKPMLIIKSKKATQVFKILDIANDTKIALRSILPLDFMDTPITIQGIVAQKNIYEDPSVPDDEKVTKVVIWTEPASIDVQGAGSDKKITVKSQSGNEGLDYGRKVN